MTRTKDKGKADYDDTNWQDTGCEFEDKCLDCERAPDKCPAGSSRIFQRDRRQRHIAEIRARKAEGQSDDEICKAMKISVRTVQRATGGK
jgi:hypothetical protein